MSSEMGGRLKLDFLGIFPEEEEYKAKIDNVESFLENIKNKTSIAYSKNVFTMPAPYLNWGFNSYIDGHKIYIRDDRLRNIGTGTANYFEGEILRNGDKNIIIGKFKNRIFLTCFLLF